MEFRIETSFYTLKFIYENIKKIYAYFYITVLNSIILRIMEDRLKKIFFFI